MSENSTNGRKLVTVHSYVNCNGNYVKNGTDDKK